MGDDSAAVRTAVLSLQRATGLPMVFGGALSGRDRMRISELVGGTTGSLDGLVVRRNYGLGGKAMALGRPVWVSDYPRASTISHDYDGPVGAEGLLSIVAVPIVVRRQIRGVLYGALREPLSIADRVLAMTVQAARDLEQDLAVQDEADQALARAAAPSEAGPAAARWEEVRAVHAELRGLADQITDPGVRARLLEASTRLAAAGADPSSAPETERPPGPSLSPRELDVLSYVAIGCTNAQVARQLGLLPATVKSYLKSAMRKLNSHTRMEAVNDARRAGLLP
ncbi:LuxR C-terminal-related transcriptional regulator [Actinomadura rugatobispora]|uniref:LuxR C-terminal-related transcriptional regulator n=1 Tax=Actinomadura rugatobispora TaxID=1994 RepID=A0ABW0ZXQ4_9ACTN|nr:helix-turn-helix transcriptional regulator [Actinomadura rugatobispora]